MYTSPVLRLFVLLCWTMLGLHAHGQVRKHVPSTAVVSRKASPASSVGQKVTPSVPVASLKDSTSTLVKTDSGQWRLYEKGDATYYSHRTHGRLMASGERYDKNGYFCAHKKLPFGTKIRVVNKKNGKEVIVLVKDRGPFAKGRVIDLSNKAAEDLDMLRAGVVPVELWIEEK